MTFFITLKKELFIKALQNQGFRTSDRQYLHQICDDKLMLLENALILQVLLQQKADF